MSGTGRDTLPLVVGRYALFDALASGGMATVHLGRLLGPAGFGRTVAVKRLHAHYTSDPEFTTMFMDEARIALRIQHPNVVPMIDIIESPKGLFLVMEYVHGEPLARLLRTCRTANIRVPLPIVASIMHDVLLGLHAAHETKSPSGELLNVVHRDVSPQNVIVGTDGVARVLDFGVAKAAGRIQVTGEGQIKGKLTYMSPEQIQGRVDRRADVFAASIILWEALAGRRMHETTSDVDIVTKVIEGDFPPPSSFRTDLSSAVDAIVMRGLTGDLLRRYQSARDMALDLERYGGLASPREVGAWVEGLGHDTLDARARMVAAMEKAAAALSPEAPSQRGSKSAATLPPPRQGATTLTSTPVSALTPASMTGITGTPVTSKVRRSRRSRALLYALGTLSVVVAAIGVVLGVVAFFRRTRPITRIAATETSPSAARTPSDSIAASSVTPAAPDPSAPVAPASASTRDRADKADAAPPARGAPPVSVRPRRAGAASCEPPYTVDENGRRKYKTECLGSE